MSLAGEIRIAIADKAVTIHSTRPQLLSRLFVGKSVDETLALIPRLFSICRYAQSIAAVRAAEHALERSPNIIICDNRRLLLKLEMLHEHLWKLLVDLPPRLGLRPRVDDMATATQSLRPLMQEVAAHAGLQAERLAAPSRVMEKPATSLLTRLRHLLFGENGWPKPSSTTGFAALLMAALAPLDWRDRRVVGETGPLARVDVPKVGCLQSRLLALLQECDQLLRGSYNAPLWHRNGVETARGCLRYEMVVTDDQVASLAIVAPTDHNFAPAGPAAVLLTALPPAADLRYARADALVKLLNPCVAYRLQVDTSQEAMVHA